MSHQINLFILIFGAIQGFLLSLWFLRNSQNRVSIFYLAAFLTVVSLQLTFKVVTKEWAMEHVVIPYVISYKLPYLIGPLLFLFIRYREQQRWRPADLIHFLPFVFFTALFFLWTGPQLHPYAQALLQSISLLVYVHLSLRLRDEHVRQFIAFVASAEFIIIVTLAVMYVYYGNFPDVRMLFILLTCLIYWISYKVLSRSKLFFQVATIMKLPQQNVRYAHSSLKPDEAGRIERELIAMMNQTKIFRDPTLSIDKLATKLGTSRHHLSQVLNERLRKTYGDYISEFRLEDAREQLSDSASLKFTVAGIAMDSGFNSLSSFNDAFKKRYQVTPSQYRRQAMKARSA